MLGKKYTEYILNKGNLVNIELKNNIYTSDKLMIKLLLVDYVLETFRNYDVRNCPDYEDKKSPLIPENIIYRLMTEDMFAYILTESGDYIVSENSNTSILQQILTSEDDPDYFGDELFMTEDDEYMTTEDEDYIATEDHTSKPNNYLSSEGEYEKYLYDQSFIENFLTNLIKDIQC